MSERKIRAWEAAGLIDAATAERIRGWETQHSRPLAMWAVVGIAALSIGLGLVSVVAANWDEIPAMLRLSLHFGLLALGAAALWLKGDALAEQHPWFHEAALFVFGILGLTFFGHVGQVYQTSSPLWQPLAAWLVLFAPLLLSRGLSWLSAAALMVVLAIAVWDYASLDMLGGDDRTRASQRAWLALVTGLPVLVAPFAAWRRGLGERSDFWRRLRQLAVGYAVGGASLLAIVAGWNDFARDRLDALPGLATWAAIGLLAALGVLLLRPTPGGRATATVLGASAVVTMLSYPLSGEQVLGALLFMALWAAIGWASLAGGWRRLFQLAVAVLALRLIVLSFELNDDLLASGFGLILSGLATLGIAWGAVQVSRRYAPPAGGGE